MKSLSLPVYGLVFLSALARAGSFYDNPEQDPLTLKQQTEEELLRKWDFEVRIGEGSFSLLVLLWLLFIYRHWAVPLLRAELCNDIVSGLFGP